MAHGKRRFRKGRSAGKGSVTNVCCIALFGAVWLIIWGILTVQCICDRAWKDTAVCGLFMLAAVPMILTVNWRIDFDANGFTHRNIFRISQRFRWADVTSITIVHLGTETDYWIRAGRRRILVDSAALNRHPFLRLLREHCPEQYARAVRRSGKT